MLNSFPAIHIQLVILLSAMVSIVIGGVLCFKGYKSNMLIIIACGFYAGAIVPLEILRQFRSPVVTALGMVVVGCVTAFAVYKFKSARELIISGVLLMIAVYYIVGMTGYQGGGFSEKGAIVGILIGMIMVVYMRIFGGYINIISTALSGGGMVTVSLWAISRILGGSLGTGVSVLIWLMVSAIGFLIHISIIHIDSIYSSSYVLKRKFSAVIFQSYMPQGMQKSCENYCVYCGRALNKENKKCVNCGFGDESSENKN